MNRFRLIINSLLYYWRAHLGAALGTLFAVMALTGALIVGDCVDHTLRAVALNRLGTTEYALIHPSRFFRASLADALGDELSTTAAPVIHTRAIARKGDGTRSANSVSLYGVDSRFWSLGWEPFDGFPAGEGSVIINRPLAERLSVREGDFIIIRIENPSVISREIPLTTVDDSSLAFRLPIAKIADDRQMGRFDLNANQVAPYNAFLPLSFLQEKTGKTGQINSILLKGREDSTLTAEQIAEAMRRNWNLDDAQLTLQSISHPGWYELRTERIFFDSRILHGLVQDTLQNSNSNSHMGILTYFVNEIRAGDHAAPYSMVAAIQENSVQPALYPETLNLDTNGIIINEWLAEDLSARKGDTLTLTYNVLGPMRKLIERKRTFTVHAVIPMSNPLCDPSLMPDFPGIAKTEHCREWDPGFLIDLEKIRGKDEAYWDLYKGTPKAFVSLQAGQAMWSNLYGDLTAIRFHNESDTEPQIKNRITSVLNPADFGLLFQPVREIALRAVDRALNFGVLFISLSFFLIVSALILTALLYIFGVERRARQTGVLFAVGFPEKRIRHLYWSEGLGVAIVGSALGVIAALVYSRFMIWALSTVWSGAVAGMRFEMFFSPMTLIGSFLAGAVISACAIWIAVWRQSKPSIQSLLATHGGEYIPVIKSTSRGLWLAAVAGVSALALFLFISPDDATAAAGQFFGIGALLLIAGISVCQTYLSHIMKEGTNRNLTLTEIGKRNIGRRRGRSLAVIGIFSIGVFLTIAVGANRRDALLGADSRTSGTGGFAYYGETALPLLYDLNTEEGCNEFGLSRSDLPNLTVYPLRLREGDEANCLNLNQAQNPRLIGVNADRFSSLGAFQFVQTADGKIDPETAWKLLDQRLDDGSIPAIVDQSTAMWALGKSIGDTLTYTDENGNSFQVTLAGLLSNSIFQGSVLISEEHFMERFPSSGGYRILLLDIPQADQTACRDTLFQALQDLGLELTPAGERLAAFSQMENTYLSIFQILGGLGLILGCAGIGVVVMRNILERRSEFALMRAVGFSNAAIRRMVVTEHLYLLFFGLDCGVISGLTASLPALHFHTATYPYLSLSLTLLSILISGVVGIYLATASALREKLIQALRSE